MNHQRYEKTLKMRCCSDLEVGLNGKTSFLSGKAAWGGAWRDQKVGEEPGVTKRLGRGLA